VFSIAAQSQGRETMRAFGGFVVGILFTMVAAVVAGYIGLETSAIPANADATPGPIEKFVAGTALRATLRNEASKTSNPVALTDANLINGIRLYGTHCTICHGTAAGNGSRSPIAKGEYPSPPQLASDGVEDDPDGWTFWKIKHGIRWTGMPSWKDDLTDQQIWTLALFLKHMDNLTPAAEAVWQATSDGTSRDGSRISIGRSPN
jgi:thiosulfate dehydrogenase